MTFKPYPHAETDGSFERGLAMLRAKVVRRLADEGQIALGGKGDDAYV